MCIIESHSTKVQKTLDVQLQMPSESKIPSLFLFDIQPEQVAPLQEILASMDQSLLLLTPMVRARLRSVNDQPFEKKGESINLREEERESRFRNRGMNLTFQDQLKASERVVKGVFDRPYAPNTNTLQVSLEKGLPKRLNIQMEISLRLR
ncbi:MAG: hypothetical protein R3A45_11395 [Bdellovibrionota bacterium]